MEERRIPLSILKSKLMEVLHAVLPITVIVLILNFTLTPISGTLLLRFLIGAALVIVGLAIFLFGVDIGITPIGNSMGSTVARTNKIWIVMTVGFLMGFFISIAEPDLYILAGEVESVTSGVIAKVSIVAVVSIGIAALLSSGLARIVYNIPLNRVLTVLYGVILVLSFFTSREFLAISFDASGATTGALTVPFILSLAAGVSELKKNREASEDDSFGLVAIASTGAIIAVMIMSIITKTDKLTGGVVLDKTPSTAIIGHFIQKTPVIAGEILLALLPILMMFILLQKISLRISKKALRKILVGLLFTFIGLVVFLTGVNGGFMDVGSVIGYEIASLDSKAYVVVVAFILGFVTILAEPAVHVLTNQIEEVTSGYVKKKAVMLTLSIGVGSAVALSMLRILIPEVHLWHYLLPGYLLAIGMTYFVPGLFIGIAFDSGGVASGPMTATFILAFAQGVAEATEGANVLVDGFGMIAMVALTPLIALQVLGFIFKIKSKKGGLESNGE